MAPPHYIGKSAVVENSSISEGCEIEGNVDYSVISSNVTIEAGADVRYSVVMPGAHIKKGAKVYYSIVAENAVIQADAKVGEIPEQLQNPADWGMPTHVDQRAKVGIGDHADLGNAALHHVSPARGTLHPVK